MPVIESQVDRNSDEFRKNRERMLAAIQEFRDAEASVQATSDKSRERFRKRKQLMPRERIALLLDRGAPFLERHQLEERRASIEQQSNSFARHQLLPLAEALARLVRRRLHAGFSVAELLDGGEHALAVFPELVAVAIDLGFDDGHISRPALWGSRRGGSR